MKKLTLEISGMHCASCAMSIDFDLEDIDGVSSSKTSYVKSLCNVIFDEKCVGIDDIINSIKKTGYDSKKLDGKI